MGAEDGSKGGQGEHKRARSHCVVAMRGSVVCRCSNVRNDVVVAER